MKEVVLKVLLVVLLVKGSRLKGIKVKGRGAGTTRLAGSARLAGTAR